MTLKQNSTAYIFQTSSGKISAFRENGIIRAKSIRYARSERFKMPIPVEAGVHEIPEKTPVCPQHISPLLDRLIQKTDVEAFEPDESPQFLTITRPDQIREDEKLPVIVWIHGGSYEIGCGDLPTSDPSAWVREQHILVVSLSYRLGLFGFLGGDDQRPANLGLFDIMEGLRWIRKYIQDFGGDPGNITLFGQSSGGDAIAHLMISDGIDGLFRRAIIHSAPLGFRTGRQRMSHEFFLKTEVLKNEPDPLKMVEQYGPFLPSFRKYGLKTSMPFCTQYGYPPLCSEADSLGKWKANARKYDVLIGSNRDETAFYVKTAREGLYTYLHEKILNRIVRTTTKSIYEKPARLFAQNYAEGGGNIYRFTIHSTLKENYIGASHCIDLPLIFADQEAWKDSELLQDVSWDHIFENGKKIRALWAEFARTGNIADDSEIPAVLKVEKVPVP